MLSWQNRSAEESGHTGIAAFASARFERTVQMEGYSSRPGGVPLYHLHKSRTTFRAAISTVR